MDVGIVPFGGNHRVCDARGRQAVGQVWTGAAEGCLPLRNLYITLRAKVSPGQGRGVLVGRDVIILIIASTW